MQESAGKWKIPTKGNSRRRGNGIAHMLVVMKMSNAFYPWRKAFSGLFFPYRNCLCCGKVSVDAPLCTDCRSRWQDLRSCRYCATFVSSTEAAEYRCQNCRGGSLPFAMARAALPYEGFLRERLLAFKYYGRTGLRWPFAALLLETFQQFYDGLQFDAIVPMPLAAGRYQERGYNQVELLTELLAAELDLPHGPQLLHRVRETRPLAELNRGEREQELAGAFQGTAANGMRLLLVDDIYTTGMTMRGAAQALRNSGAREIYAPSVAASRDF